MSCGPGGACARLPAGVRPACRRGVPVRASLPTTSCHRAGCCLPAGARSSGPSTCAPRARMPA
eukprot:4228798-Alexandrium_andersonii.AAC.1